MKALFSLLTILALNTSFAGGVTPLKSGDENIYGAKAELVSIRKICPATPGGVTCMAYGSIATIKVHLNGCVDRFAGYSATYDTKSGKNVIYFAGVSIANEMSIRAYCTAMPVKLIEIMVPFEGNAKLVNLEFVGTSQR